MGDIKEKPSKYWADRQIADVKKTDAEALTAFKEMQSHYSKLEKELNNEVAYFYQKYGKDNILEFSSLRNKADKSDLDMLYQDWEGFAEKYPTYAHLKPVRGNMYKLDRYEMLIEKSRYQLSELGAKEAEIMNRSLKGTAKSTYSSMGKALSGNVAMLDDLQADKMIGTKWISGQNYSDRLWKNKDKLLGHLDYELRNGVIRGDDFNTMTAHLRNITGVGKSDAERLIRTETSYIANRANMQNYIDNGLKFYEYLAVEDSRTSQACNGFNGKILPIDKAIIGTNYPPLHPNCRSRALPVSNRRAKLIEDKKLLKSKSTKNRQIKINTSNDTYNKLGKDHYDELHDLINKAPANEKKLWELYEDKFVYGSTNHNRIDCYSPLNRHVSINAQNIRNPRRGWEAKNEVLFHELGHFMDHASGMKINSSAYYKADSWFSYTYKNNLFGNTLNDEVKEHIKVLGKVVKNDLTTFANDINYLHQKGYISNTAIDLYKQTGRIPSIPKYNIAEVYSAMKRELRALPEISRANISDIFDAGTLAKANAGLGHGKNYWKNSVENQSVEAFAEFYASSIANKDSLKVLKNYFPKSYKVYNEIIKEMIKGGV